MDSWLVQLLTLLGVAIGAIASFVSTRWLERTRWQREETIRWDTKRLDCYGEFAATTNRFIQTAMRLAVGLGLPGTGQPLDPATGLPALAAAEEELGVKWEQILMLASPGTITAGREWRHVAWHIEWFARGLRNNPAEYTKAVRDNEEAKKRFYTVARADLAVISGEIPDDPGPPAWSDEH